MNISRTNKYVCGLAIVVVGVFFNGSTTSANIIYSATTGNSTQVNNNGVPVISGATPDLLVANSGVNNNTGGFSSTDGINTLLAANSLPALTATDTVTISVTVDSITGGTFRANGIEFGLAPSAGAFRPAGHLLLGQAASNNGSDVRVVDGAFQDAGSLDFNSNQAQIVNGLTLTLTANSAGYSFFLEDIVVAGSENPLYTDGDTTALISGTFSGTEFLDNFSTGHLYVAVQHQSAGAPITTDYSNATIEVTSAIPEPGSLALLGLGLAGVLLRRRKS